MISADIPMTLTSTANSSLSLCDFIEYSIKNDLNIVTSKWLAHTRKITISEAKKTLNSFWESNGKAKNYFATFSVLSFSEDEGYLLELIDHDKLDSVKHKIISSEIYAIHAVQLKDKPVQLGMINVPIYDLPGEIVAPWIDSETFPAIQSSDEVKLAAMTKESLEISEEPKNDETSFVNRPIESQSSESADAPPPGKKMKMIKTTRTFMQNGYQMTETVNELVPCDDNEDVEMESAPAAKPAATTAAAPVKAKQSSMMSFFKKK